jgi:protein gp37
MGADSKIEWTHHTFSPWWGCTKITAECRSCYAEAWAKRTGHQVWGDSAPRRFFGDKHWAEPLKWERNARDAGERRRVFCASMADVFEDREDLLAPRARLWRLIVETPHLDWMLLTKRPEDMVRLSPPEFRHTWPRNAWAGTTGGCQETVDRNVPALLEVPAPVHFLSAEPLLEDIIIAEYLVSPTGADMVADGCVWRPHLDLVIAGAESGAKPRGMREEWVRSLRDQCVDAGASFFYKQKLDERHRKVSLPMLDGQQWAQLPEAR